MSSPSRSPLPPPSPPAPSRSSQSTRSERLSHASNLEEATFSRKKTCLFTLRPFHFSHWSRHWKLTCSVPSEGLLLHISCEKRGALSVPAAHGHFSLSLKEEKGVTGAIDLIAFNLVIIRQNVCLGRQVYNCIS